MEPKSIKKPFKIETEIDAKNDAVGSGSRSRTSTRAGGLGGALIRVTRRQAMPYHAKPSQASHEARREARGDGEARRDREAAQKAKAKAKRPQPSHADARKRGGGY